MDVTMDPNDLPLDGRTWARGAWNQSLDENTLYPRIDIGKILPGKGLIHNCHWQGACHVLFGKTAAPDNLYSEGVEVFRSDHGETGARTRGRITCRLAGDADRKSTRLNSSHT